jgi:hypothetical protein
LPDGTSGAWMPRHVTTALDGLNIEIKPGRLIAWPNYACMHSGQPSDPVSTGGVRNADTSDARWILGPVAIVPGRTRLVQSGDCGGSGGAPRRPAPDPPTSSKHAAQDYAGIARARSLSPALLIPPPPVMLHDLHGSVILC